MQKRTWTIPALLAVALGGAVSACSESTFSGSTTSATGQPSDLPTPAPDADTTAPAPAPQTSCVSGDKVNFQWTGDVKTCIDNHMTYNFDTHQCAAIRPAQFPCDWAHITAELAKRGVSATTPNGLLTDKVKAAAANGAKLVSCGQSQDGNRIVAQWISNANGIGGSCAYDPSSNQITSGCYTLYSGAIPNTGMSQAEQVYACMNQL